MIKTKTITLNVNNKHKKYYLDKGYKIIDNTFTINVFDLPKYSKLKIECICDIDGCFNETYIAWNNYIKITNNMTDKYYCISCKYKKVKITNSLKSDEEKRDIIKRTKETNILKWGHECTLQNEDILRNTKMKIFEKYGHENISQNEDIKKQKENTCLKNNGVKSSFLIKENIKKQKDGYLNFLEKQKKELISKYTNKIGDNFIIKKYENSIFTIYDKRDDTTFEINNTILKDRLYYENTEISTIKNPIGAKCVSGMEISLRNYLETLNIQTVLNNKNIIYPKELDIYIPSHNLAIEFNGLYWHNEEHLDKNYHLNKSISCNEKGIDLIHIFDDDWVFKNNIVKSIISNRLGKTENKLYARYCIIKEVNDSKLIRKFLDDNHIQGYSQSNIKIGLYYENELVSLMTFGYRYTNNTKEFELIRFCNKLNTNIIGASSRLFKYFLNNYDYSEILSYSDYSMFNGKMYETLGFEKIHLSEPNYFWIVDNRRRHRFNYNKKKLIKEGFDASKTEIEIMHNRGYRRIWGCGQIRWIYKKRN